MTRVIGLAGVAGAGKDTFLELLQEELPNIRRFALADNLKKEVNPFFIEKYGVDIFSCSREVKDVLRPILVVHGKMRRMASNGQHWTSMLQKEIEAFLNSNPEGIAVVTDIRYDVYENDEVYWLKNILGGKLVHISRYSEFENIKLFRPSSNTVKVYLKAPNEDEKENDPKLISAADYRIEWPTTIRPDKTIDKEPLIPYVKKFTEFLRNQNR